MGMHFFLGILIEIWQDSEDSDLTPRNPAYNQGTQSLYLKMVSRIYFIISEINILIKFR